MAWRDGDSVVGKIDTAGIVFTVAVQPGTGAGLPVILSNPQGAAASFFKFRSYERRQHREFPR